MKFQLPKLNFKFTKKNIKLIFGILLIVIIIALIIKYVNATGSTTEGFGTIHLDEDYVNTFNRTGCPNQSPDLGYWKTISDDGATGDMYSYCTLVKDGNASEGQKLMCGGTDNANFVPEKCERQSEIIRHNPNATILDPITERQQCYWGNLKSKFASGGSFNGNVFDPTKAPEVGTPMPKDVFDLNNDFDYKHNKDEWVSLDKLYMKNDNDLKMCQRSSDFNCLINYKDANGQENLYFKNEDTALFKKVNGVWVSIEDDLSACKKIVNTNQSFNASSIFQDQNREITKYNPHTNECKTQFNKFTDECHQECKNNSAGQYYREDLGGCVTNPCTNISREACNNSNVLSLCPEKCAQKCYQANDFKCKNEPTFANVCSQECSEVARKRGELKQHITHSYDGESSSNYLL